MNSRQPRYGRIGSHVAAGRAAGTYSRAEFIASLPPLGYYYRICVPETMPDETEGKRCVRRFCHRCNLPVRYDTSFEMTPGRRGELIVCMPCVAVHTKELLKVSDVMVPDVNVVYADLLHLYGTANIVDMDK